MSTVVYTGMEARREGRQLHLYATGTQHNAAGTTGAVHQRIAVLVYHHPYWVAMHPTQSHLVLAVATGPAALQRWARDTHGATIQRLEHQCRAIEHT
jgi:hypothetical protein